MRTSYFIDFESIVPPDIYAPGGVLDSAPAFVCVTAVPFTVREKPVISGVSVSNSAF